MTIGNEKLTALKTDSWRLFDAISRRYDLLNRILSLGLDKVWRREIIKYIPDKPGQMVLDVATGTADVLIELLETNAPIRIAYGIDMSEHMLKIGRTKIEQRGLSSRAMLQKGDAMALNFLDKTFELTTIAFGIRNLPLLIKGLTEMYRVLKPEGRVLILEFSIPQNPILRLGHFLYLHWIVPCIGFIFTGNYRAYHYLNQTIESFPYGDRFCKIITQVGFKNVKAHPIMGGIATIYQGDKA